MSQFRVLVNKLIEVGEAMELAGSEAKALDQSLASEEESIEGLVPRPISSTLDLGFPVGLVESPRPTRAQSLPYWHP